MFGNEAFRNDVVINPNEFCQLAIEGEMAVKVGEDGQIKAAFPIIELHNFIFRAGKEYYQISISKKFHICVIVLKCRHYTLDNYILSSRYTLNSSLN